MSHLSLCATVFASISVLLAGTLSAQDYQPAGPASRLLAHCARVAANATFQLEEGTATFEFPPVPRSARCGRFVGDVVVQGNALPPSGQWLVVVPVGSLAMEMHDVTQAQCPGVEVKVDYYSRPIGGTTFTKIGGGRLVGAWLSGPFTMCELRPTDGFEEPDTITLLNSTAVVYRIAVSASIGGVRKPVRYGVNVYSPPT